MCGGGIHICSFPLAQAPLFGPHSLLLLDSTAEAVNDGSEMHNSPPAPLSLLDLLRSFAGYNLCLTNSISNLSRILSSPYLSFDIDVCVIQLLWSNACYLLLFYTVILNQPPWILYLSITNAFLFDCSVPFKGNLFLTSKEQLCFVSWTRAQAIDTRHSPASGFSLFHWSRSGCNTRNAAVHQQRQGRQRLLASKHGCKECKI